MLAVSNVLSDASVRECEIEFAQYCLAAFFRREPAVAIDPDLVVPTFCDLLRLNKISLLVLPLLRNQIPSLDRYLDQIQGKTILLNSHCLRTLSYLQTAFEQEAVEYLVFKGPVQQDALYNNLFLKPCADIDILVRSSDYARASAALEAAGYRISSGTTSLWWRIFLGEQHFAGRHADLSTVDLHHRLQQPGSPSPRDIDVFLRRKRVSRIAGRETPTTSPGDTLLIACISIAKALYNREPCGGYACDVRASLMLLTAETLEECLRDARAQGLEGTLMLGVRAADVVIGGQESALSSRARNALKGVSDVDLTAMVLAPWRQDIAWPHRRSVLWDLCGRQPGRYGIEAGWMAIGEIGRRLMERSEA